MKVDRLRLVGLGGSNKIMQGELSRLCRRALPGERSREILQHPVQKMSSGSISYPFFTDLAQIAATYHRTCARALWDLYDSHANRLEPLYEELFQDVANDERAPFADGDSISVHAFGVDWMRAGERQIVGAVKNALLAGCKKRGAHLRVEPTSPDLVVHVRTVRDAKGAPRLAVSLDLVGKPMHQRGYRKLGGTAPLREDLAAALVFLARHDPHRQVVVDPLAGSGTILIEAALMASAAPVETKCGPPPTNNRFNGPLGRLPNIPDHPLPEGPLFQDTSLQIFGADIDPQAERAVHHNARNAGVESQLIFHAGDFRGWEISDRLPADRDVLILSNPPYGVRLGAGTKELRRLYRDLGLFCRGFSGAQAGFLLGEPNERPEHRESTVALFLRSFGGKPRIRKPLFNGPLRAQFLLYDL